MAAQPHAGSWLDRAIVGRIRHNVCERGTCLSRPVPLNPLASGRSYPAKVEEANVDWEIPDSHVPTCRGFAPRLNPHKSLRNREAISR